jgi:Transglutaminase-like superfamily
MVARRPSRQIEGADYGDVVSDVAQARELAVAVRLAARTVPDATCLRRSLVLHDLLCRHGIANEIRFGVRPGSLDGERQPYQFHAWVVAGGEVVSESPRYVDGFVPFDAIEPGMFS